MLLPRHTPLHAHAQPTEAMMRGYADSPLSFHAKRMCPRVPSEAGKEAL